jgi:DNA topoisomerase VI subunit B
MAPQPARLERVAFKTSRLLDFVGRRELIAQIGHGVEDWPLVVLKELVDNALDSAEEAGVAPQIVISVSTDPGSISIADNGPGIPAQTVTDILDYTVRVSSREAYVSPTRGAQGNALKTLLAMPFALDGERGETLIEAGGAAHRIIFAVDRIRQEPKIERANGPSPVTKRQRHDGRRILRRH